MKILRYIERGSRTEHIVRHDGHIFKRVKNGVFDPHWRFRRDDYDGVTPEEAGWLEEAFQKAKSGESRRR